MKRFKFPLGRLERMRDLRRRQARARLALELARVRACAREREQREGELEASLFRKPPPESASDPRVLRELADWREGIRRLLRLAAEEQTRAVERADAAADEHTEQARGHRALERLRERRFRSWLQDAELEEQKFYDEAHLLRLARRRAEEDA